jgi:hypothetical protein
MSSGQALGVSNPGGSSGRRNKGGAKTDFGIQLEVIYTYFFN